MDELNVKLEVFEGPLDLLLHLIKTLEIDIYDIPIADITSQYMAYIHTMSVLRLDVAGEYIVMAATLMSIKSKLLLPKKEVEFEEDSQDLLEEEDPRDALVSQLLEYRKYKYAAGVLKEKEQERGFYFTKEASDLDEYKEEEVGLKPNQVTMIELFLAFHDVLERKKDQQVKETTIQTDEETIEAKMTSIRSALTTDARGKSGLAFTSLFQSYTRNEIVTTFMALLELMKSGEVCAKQEYNYQPIYLFAAENVPERQE